MSNLASYLEQNCIKQSAFALQLGISRSYLSLILSGKRGVDLDLAFKIEEQTRGEVTAKSFASQTDGDPARSDHPESEKQIVSENQHPSEPFTAAR